MKKAITVKVDESTYRWLKALANANSNSQLNQHKVTPAELLAQAAFCFADYAGRREGSWEAEVGRNLLMASGYQESIPFSKVALFRLWEDRRNAQARARAAATQDKQLKEAVIEEAENLALLNEYVQAGKKGAKP
ncbi:MAG TPA: hypothetical protein VHH88_10425 [Verrucomicrobiae bacterium]|nr:hypothetical protein [Verrucomicrobiae bacterium]